MDELLWRAIDLLAQIILRSHLASAWDREQWEQLVAAKQRWPRS